MCHRLLPATLQQDWEFLFEEKIYLKRSMSTSSKTSTVDCFMCTMHKIIIPLLPLCPWEKQPWPLPFFSACQIKTSENSDLQCPLFPAWQTSVPHSCPAHHSSLARTELRLSGGYSTHFRSVEGAQERNIFQPGESRSGESWGARPGPEIYQKQKL